MEHMMSMSTQGASEDSLRRRRQTVYGDWNEFSSDDLTATRVAEPAFFTGEVPPENRLDQAYESLEYDVTQNPILIKELEEQAVKKKHRTSALRYTLLFLIGFCTGLSASIIDILISTISMQKFRYLQYLFKHYRKDWFLLIPGFAWCLSNTVPVTIAALLVTLLAPVAAGSGIPQVKCYLNGINVPFVMRAKTMLVKGIGVVLAVSGGLAAGKEGPMIHIGSATAAGLSQGRITWCGLSSRHFRPFRNDAEKRDFVGAGAAAGVAAAFGAPVGGLLFTLEEGASFLFQRLTWTTLFASMVSMFTLAFFRGVFSGSPFKFTPGGLISFGEFDFLECYNVYELLVFVVMGCLGGLLGALFVKLNSMLTQYRQLNVKSKSAKVCEAALVAALTAASSVSLILLTVDCHPITLSSTHFPLQLTCADNEYNSIAALVFTTPEKSLHTLFHDPPDTFSPFALCMFLPYIFAITCLTFGLSVPAGLFIPSLLIGATWGRIIGNLLNKFQPALFPDPGKFALIGAAAQLGGIVRMIASLTVILMEASGSIIVGLPLLLTLVAAKYTGDWFTESIYDTHISLNKIALLPWEPDPFSVKLRAFEVMSCPAVALDPVMSVRDLVRIVRGHPHHAFPLVQGVCDPARFVYGFLVGMISSQHLALILKKRAFLPLGNEQFHKLTIEDYDDAYPRFEKLPVSYSSVPLTISAVIIAYRG
ncbi:hypothetical protein AAHC03_026078 [Spirometra sp. Aus1]